MTLSGIAFTNVVSSMDSSSRQYISSTVTGTFIDINDSSRQQVVAYQDYYNYVEVAYIDSNNQYLVIQQLFPSGTFFTEVARMAIGNGIGNPSVDRVQGIRKVSPELQDDRDYVLYYWTLIPNELRKIEVSTGTYSDSLLDAGGSYQNKLIHDRSWYWYKVTIDTPNIDFNVTIKSLDMESEAVATEVDWDTPNDGYRKVITNGTIPVSMFSKGGMLNWATSYFNMITISGNNKKVVGKVVLNGTETEVFDYPYTSASSTAPYEVTVYKEYQFNRDDYFVCYFFDATSTGLAAGLTDKYVTLNSLGGWEVIESADLAIIIATDDTVQFPMVTNQINIGIVKGRAFNSPVSTTGTWHSVDIQTAESLGTISIPSRPHIHWIFPHVDNISGEIYLVASTTPVDAGELYAINGSTMGASRRFPSDNPAQPNSAENGRYPFSMGGFFSGITYDQSTPSGSWYALNISYLRDPSYPVIIGNNEVLNIIEHN